MLQDGRRVSLFGNRWFCILSCQHLVGLQARVVSLPNLSLGSFDDELCPFLPLCVCRSRCLIVKHGEDDGGLELIPHCSAIIVSHGIQADTTILGS